MFFSESNLAAEIAAAKSWNDLSLQQINTARGSAGKPNQFARLVSADECPSCGREWSVYAGCRWTDCPDNL